MKPETQEAGVDNMEKLSPQEKYWQIFESLDSRNLPLEIHRTLARLQATESNEISLVVKSPVDLELKEPLLLPDKAELSYCRSEEKPEAPGEAPSLFPQRDYLYVWKKKLDKVDEEAVRESYRQVSTVAALLAFSYDLPIEWEDPRVPPSITIKSRSIDIRKFDHLVQDIHALPPKTREAVEKAVRWYWMGQLINNVSHATLYEYICYWNVIEVLAEEIGEAKTEDEEAEKTIRSKLKGLLEEEDLQDALEAFRHRKKLRQKVRSFLEKTIAEKEPNERATKIFQKIFEEKKDDYTLYRIRNKIAHGGFLVAEAGLERIIQSRMWELRSYAKDLLFQTTRSRTLQRFLETKCQGPIHRGHKNPDFSGRRVSTMSWSSTTKGQKESAGRASRNIVKLEGLWKDVPFDITDEDVRQARRELGQQIATRAKKAR